MSCDANRPLPATTTARGKLPRATMNCSMATGKGSPLASAADRSASIWKSNAACLSTGAVPSPQAPATTVAITSTSKPIITLRFIRFSGLSLFCRCFVFAMPGYHRLLHFRQTPCAPDTEQSRQCQHQQRQRDGDARQQCANSTCQQQQQANGAVADGNVVGTGITFRHINQVGLATNAHTSMTNTEDEIQYRHGPEAIRQCRCGNRHQHC